MAEDNNQAPGSQWNAAALKMARLNDLIKEIQICRTEYKSWDPVRFRFRFQDWVSYLYSFKMELYAKLSLDEQKRVDGLFELIEEDMRKNPIHKFIKNKGTPVFAPCNEEIYLKILNKIEAELMIFFNKLNMDAPDKPQEGGYN